MPKWLIFVVCLLFFCTIAGATRPDSAIESPSECVPFNFSTHSSNTTFEMWGWQGWFVLFDIIVLFLILFFDLMPIEFAMVSCVLILALVKIITTSDMIEGFANPGILAIAVLLIVAEGLTATGAMDYFIGKFLGFPNTLGEALVRLMLPCAFIAAWISSTAVVALVIPIVLRWSKQIKQPPSRLLIPMCYAVHLGGTITLIGTTTNLILYGLYQDYYCKTMSIFELSTVGIPNCFIGLSFILLFDPFLLPSAEDYEKRINEGILISKHKTTWFQRFVQLICCSSTSHNNSTSQHRESVTTAINNGEFTLEATVPLTPTLLENQSIDEAGLRRLDGLFLTSVFRFPDSYFRAVGPEFRLQRGDRLSFAGLTEAFLPMCKEKGLIPAVQLHSTNNVNEGSHLLDEFMVEAVIREQSDLIGKTMKQVSFRTRYHASVLSIFRLGTKLQPDRLGQVELKVGDVLLLIAGESFDWEKNLDCKRDLKPRSNNTQLRNTTTTTTGNNNVTIDKSNSKEYIFGMKVSSKQRLTGADTLDGLTIEEAGLRNIPGIRIVAVTRQGAIDRCIGPEFRLMSNDTLWCSARSDGLSNLRRIPGLEDLVANQVDQLNVPVQNRRLVEVVVNLTSDLLHKTVRESRFRTRFNAAIVAVQRNGQRVLEKIGNIELEPGDVLILDTGPEFSKRFAQDDNFLLISEVESSTPPRMDRFYIALMASIAMVTLTVATHMDILLFALLASGIMIFSGVLTRERAHKAVDWKIIMTIASAFGLSTAMSKTKVSNVVSLGITKLADASGAGDLGALMIVILLTEVMCALITAKAGALLMFPIAASAAARMGIDPILMVMALMLGSSEYSTPQGHPTNLMVMGPGAYRFRDYLKTGVPMELTLNCFQLVFLKYRDYWYYNTMGSISLFLFAIVLDRLKTSYFQENKTKNYSVVNQRDSLSQGLLQEEDALNRIS